MADRLDERPRFRYLPCFSGQTYVSIIYPFITILFDVLNFVSVVIGVSVSLPLMLVWIGFPLFAVFVRLWRASGQLQRIFAQWFGGLRRSHPLLHGFEYIDENNVKLPTSTAVVPLSAGDTLTRWNGDVITLAAGDSLVVIPQRIATLQATAIAAHTRKDNQFKSPASNFLKHPASRYAVSSNADERVRNSIRGNRQRRARRGTGYDTTSQQNNEYDDSTEYYDASDSQGTDPYASDSAESTYSRHEVDRRDRKRRSRRRGRGRNRGPVDPDSIVGILESPDLDDGGYAINSTSKSSRGSSSRSRSSSGVQDDGGEERRPLPARSSPSQPSHHITHATRAPGPSTGTSSPSHKSPTRIPPSQLSPNKKGGRVFVRENHGPVMRKPVGTTTEVVTVTPGADGVIRKHSNIQATLPPATTTTTTTGNRHQSPSRSARETTVEPPLPPTPAQRAEAIARAQAEIDKVSLEPALSEESETGGQGKKSKKKKKKDKKKKKGPPERPPSPPHIDRSHPFTGPIGYTVGPADIERQLRAHQAPGRADPPIQYVKGDKSVFLSFMGTIKRDFKDPATWAAVGYFMFKLPLNILVLALTCILLAVPWWFILSMIIPESFYLQTLEWSEWRWDGFRWLFTEWPGQYLILLPLGLILLYLSLFIHRALARGVAGITLRIINRSWTRNQSATAVDATEIPMSVLVPPAPTHPDYTPGTRQPATPGSKPSRKRALPALTPVSQTRRSSRSRERGIRFADSDGDSESDWHRPGHTRTLPRSAARSRTRARLEDAMLSATPKRSEVDESIPILYDQAPFADSEDDNVSIAGSGDSYDSSDEDDDSTPRRTRRYRRR